MKLKFIGATETVTGSKHLIMTEKGKQILLDCGMYQGMGKETHELNRHLSVNPSNIEAVILSHAHIDHSGNLPYLVQQGFTGKIYCTPATYDVCKLLLMDSAHIQENDIAYINKRRVKRGMPLIKPLYTTKDVERCLKYFKPIPYDAEFNLNDEISFHFTNVGHIIGSASVTITSHESDKKIKLTFTGDVGRYNDLILKAPQPFQQSDYIICESTYGDRLHDHFTDAENKLLNIVSNTCVKKKGKLIIPAFSLGRTQEIVYVLDRLNHKNLLHDIKVYVDSPLSTAVTDVVIKHSESYNDAFREYLKVDKSLFGFENLKYIQNADESKALNTSNEPCIIISASGMADAGRVKHHIMHAVSDEKNTILIVGYCSPRTLGANLLEGKKQVHIYGDYYDLKADVESIHSYSAHADYSELIQFLSCQEKEKVKTIFLVHGEEHPKLSFKEKLIAEGFKQITIPKKSSVYDLS